MVEQENERIKAHIKSVIQKKNDEIFNLNRNRDTENQIVKQDLEKVIEDNKDSFKKDSDLLKIKIERLEDELKYER